MSDTPFIKFYPGDFLAGTSGLSPAERGVYITILCLIYENDAPMARDDTRLCRRCGAPKSAFVRILSALIAEGKITESDGMLSNRRAERALMDRTNRTQNATHAANRRWTAQGEKTVEKQGCENANAMPEQCVADASQKPEPDIREDLTGPCPTLVEREPPPALDETADCVRAYNAEAERVGWPKVQKLSPQRRKMLKARLADCGGKAGWIDALEKASRSDFLTGRTGRQWTGCNFDWMVKAANFTKLMEGNYDNRNGRGGIPSGPRDRPDAALEQIARLARLGQPSGDGGA